MDMVLLLFHADSKGSGQPGYQLIQISFHCFFVPITKIYQTVSSPRLICVFAGPKDILLVKSSTVQYGKYMNLHIHVNNKT